MISPGGLHGAKLDQFKSPSAQTHPFLDEEHGAGGIQLDRQRDQTEERSENDQPDRRSQEADHTPQRRSQSGLPEVLGEDETARRERLDGELPGQPLVDLHAVLDENPPHPGLQELLDGKLATPFRHRDDDPVWTGLLDHLAKLWILYLRKQRLHIDSRRGVIGSRPLGCPAHVLIHLAPSLQRLWSEPRLEDPVAERTMR